MKPMLFAAAALALVAGTAIAPAMAAIAPATGVSSASATTNATAPRYVTLEGYNRHGQLRSYRVVMTPNPGWAANYHGFHTPGE
jgi:hypothetical protein